MNSEFTREVVMKFIIIYNGLYLVATPERDTFFRLQVSEGGDFTSWSI